MPSYNQYYPAGIFNFPPGNFAQLGTFNFTLPESPASGQIIQNIVEYFKSTSPAGQASYLIPASSHLQSAGQASYPSPASSHLQSAGQASYPSPASSHLQSAGQASYPSPASSHLQSGGQASYPNPASSHLQPITPWTNFDENQFDVVEAALASRWTKESTVVTVDTTRYVYTEEGPRIELICDPDDTWDPFSISRHRSTRGRIMFRDLPRERRGAQYDGAHQGEGTKRNLRKFWDV
ncbi:hypothetical protein TNCT_418881 [Trichonephila clavata]|uniref:Uncharacterized protein n=1 Tax=Trichonephila clavata TaxID=2740835 RepID=A0A8X6KK56_TRICU|nr:hypothetical protein TNCT_418881 [Trichonephila clavata]